MLEPKPIQNNDVKPRLVIVDRIDYDNIPELADLHNKPRKETERLLREIPPGGSDNELSTRLALHLILTDMYIGENCSYAALLSMYQACPIFLKLVEWSDDWIDPSEVSFFLDRFCELEQFDDARRVAESVMGILRRRDDYHCSDETWLLETWLHDIDCVEQRHKERQDEMMRSQKLHFDKMKKETRGLSLVVSSYFELAKRVNEA